MAVEMNDSDFQRLWLWRLTSHAHGMIFLAQPLFYWVHQMCLFNSWFKLKSFVFTLLYYSCNRGSGQKTIHAWISMSCLPLLLHLTGQEPFVPLLCQWLGISNPQIEVSVSNIATYWVWNPLMESSVKLQIIIKLFSLIAPFPHNAKIWNFEFKLASSMYKYLTLWTCLLFECMSVLHSFDDRRHDINLKYSRM